MDNRSWRRSIVASASRNRRLRVWEGTIGHSATMWQFEAGPIQEPLRPYFEQAGVLILTDNADRVKLIVEEPRNLARALEQNEETWRHLGVTRVYVKAEKSESERARMMYELNLKHGDPKRGKCKSPPLLDFMTPPSPCLVDATLGHGIQSTRFKVSSRVWRGCGCPTRS